MANALKLFSPEWCVAAQKVTNETKAIYDGFKDPKAFTMKMAFGCSDRDLSTHLEWNQGKLDYWGPPKYGEDELSLVINASVETWREAAEGRSEGGVLLMAGKIKFEKGPMSAAIENASAFNAFLRSWGQVPTDWDV
ncbi:SCP2 sterol-binding domain-containing protein [Mycobacterium sp. SM1]|uniref:SCP2 sterol-binding domain-containing protein n=1 Tax=Mycobacterium sp. SM1 TaxID=2816243 RepID=UPI001BCB6F95|nr:SCP2 sterol-binding domain-containing protein [Mycobacterium sp. SM1]MBS4730347.1 SCP2 sterol-binding domain-containing protein [Mycobacterium sp. SM1]